MELGVRLEEPPAALPQGGALAALEAGFAAVALVERAMSAFLAESDVARFNAAKSGACLEVAPATFEVLTAARRLTNESGGLFDVSLGSGAFEWSIEEAGSAMVLRKRSSGVRLDLGGIAKGYAVDRALESMAVPIERAGGVARCWANAGGDLGTRGVPIRVHLRDERRGGARPFLRLDNGALATSEYGPLARSRLAGLEEGERHVSVVSPSCLLCDALTKVVALCGRPDHPMLEAHGASAWIHNAQSLAVPR